MFDGLGQQDKISFQGNSAYGGHPKALYLATQAQQFRREEIAM